MRTVYRGPYLEGEKAGVTQSMLARFIDCPHRTYLKYLLGWRRPPSFDKAVEYGNYWHAAEEASDKPFDVWGPTPQMEAVMAYRDALLKRFPTEHREISKWARVCMTQHNIYLDVFGGRCAVEGETEPLFHERQFCVPYTLPSGRVVRLRGKIDSVHRKLGTDTAAIQENKSKWGIDKVKLTNQLRYDHQSMFYTVAYGVLAGKEGLPPLSAIAYNVIRRPLSGGRHSIRPHKPTKKNPLGETEGEFYRRLEGLIAGDPASFFQRWTVKVTPEDVARYRRETLEPLLERFCSWWDFVSECPDPFGAPQGLHWRRPNGLYSTVDEGRDDYADAAEGDLSGMERTTHIFPELEAEDGCGAAAAPEGGGAGGTPGATGEAVGVPEGLQGDREAGDRHEGDGLR